jgi:hypothetical protein
MKRLLLTLTLLALAVPATAYADSIYGMQWKYGWSTSERDASGSCSTVSGVSTGLLSGSARMACTADSGSTAATWSFRLPCRPTSMPSVHVSYGDTSGVDPDLRVRSRNSGRSYDVQLRLDGKGSAVVQRVSIGYYC